MLTSFLLLMLPMLLLAAAFAALTSFLLARRWEPVLGRLHAALIALQEGRFQRVDTEGAIDSPRTLAQSFNLALNALEQRVGAQARLEQIDRLLLESMDVEQALDAMLPRVCAVTGTHVAALLLIDRDHRLTGLITMRDLDKLHQFPSACKDKRGRLRVGG